VNDLQMSALMNRARTGVVWSDDDGSLAILEKSRLRVPKKVRLRFGLNVICPDTGLATVSRLPSLRRSPGPSCRSARRRPRHLGLGESD